MTTPSQRQDARPALPADRLQSLREALRLWPEADEAPEVPPEAVLCTFIAAPDTLPPDLVDQIRGSANCARALERLRASPAMPAPSSPGTASFLARLRRTLPAGGSHGSAQPSTAAEWRVEPAPEFGQLWTTQSRVEVWTGRRMASRWTYRPLDVVLVSTGRELPWDDMVYRVVPVTLAELWSDDRLADDEVRVGLAGGATYVAHLWLGYPVSGCQLAEYHGVLSEAALETLQVGLGAVAEGLPLPPEEGGGLPLDAVRDAEVVLERERLHACAAWLSATADARREWWEAQPARVSVPRRMELQQRSHTPALRADALALAAASHRTEPPEEASFAVAGRGVVLHVLLDMDGEHYGFLVSSRGGSVVDALDGAVVTTARSVSEPFRQGQTRLPKAAMATGFRVRFPDGTFAALRRRRTR